MKKRGRWKGKSGQTILGLPFVFIISLIVMALIVLVAFYAIGKFRDRHDQLLVNGFVSSLKSRVEETYYSAAGSQLEFEKELPLRVELVCVADPAAAKITQVDEEVWFVITRFRGREKNLFLFPEGTLRVLGFASSAFNVPLLHATENPLCFRNTGKIKLLLKNEGEYVSIIM